MEKVVNSVILVAFLLMLTASVVAGISLLVPLAGGFVLFFARGLSKRIPLRELLRASAKGLFQSRWVMLVLAFIGVMTAMWRGSGTIAYIVTQLAPWFGPAFLPVMSFALCVLISMLMGTAFGTCATAGCICMAICHASGGNAVIVAGAVLAGSYFGDRCSPVSSSALLVGQLTETDNLANVAPMLKTCVVPTVVCIAVYLVLGFVFPADGGGVSMESYRQAFQMSALTLIPAISVVVLALCRVKTVWNVLVSAVLAFALCLLLQDASFADACRWAILGFDAPESVPTMGGGGLSSMLNAICIIAIASTYSGLLEDIGMLTDVKRLVRKTSDKLGVRAATVLASVLTSAVACNQTLAIILTHELVKDSFETREACMLALENTVVTIAPLVPWSIAVMVPLSSLAATSASIPFAALLYLIPLWELVRKAS